MCVNTDLQLNANVWYATCNHVKWLKVKKPHTPINMKNIKYNTRQLTRGITVTVVIHAKYNTNSKIRIAIFFQTAGCNMVPTRF